MMFCGTSASFVRIVGCHCTICSCGRAPRQHYIRGREGAGRKDTHQGVLLRVLEVVKPEQRIVPRVEEVIRPLAAPHNHAPRRQSVGVLREDELHLLGRHVAVRPDDGLGRHDGHVAQHQRPQPLGRRDVRFERERRVHDDAVLVEDPERGRVRVCGEGVAQGRDAGPSRGHGADRVVCGGTDEEAVACGEVSVCVCVWCRRGRGGGRAPWASA